MILCSGIWEEQWQAELSAICISFGCAFASQLEWGSGLVLSGLSAMGASIIGSHLFNQALTRQRKRLVPYVKALIHSEEKFRKIFETSASLLAIITVPESVIVDVNPTWERTFGISRAEAIGRSPVELGLVDDAAAYRQWFAALQKDLGEPYAITLLLSSREALPQEVPDPFWPNVRLGPLRKVRMCKIPPRRSAEDKPR